MMQVRLGALVLALLLVGAACGDDDANPATTTSITIAVVVDHDSVDVHADLDAARSEQRDVTEAPLLVKRFDLWQTKAELAAGTPVLLQLDDNNMCLIRNRQVMVDFPQHEDDPEFAVRILRGDEEVPSDLAQLGLMLLADDPDVSPEDDAVFLELASFGLVLFQFDDEGGDVPRTPVQVSVQIRALNSGYDASPHYVMIPAPSWKFGPDDEAREVQAPSGPQAIFSDATGRVTVLDTGAIEGSAWDDSVVAEREPSQIDPHVQGHGTFVASIVNDLAPKVDVTLWAVSFGGDAIADEVSVVKALERAKGRLEDLGVVNMSFGTYPCADDFPPIALSAVIPALVGEAASHVVAAAGNDGPGHPAMYPAALPKVEAVGAAFFDGTSWVRSAFSNEAVYWAPGEGIVGRYPAFESGYAVWSGTSFAAPHYAACLATGNCK